MTPGQTGPFPPNQGDPKMSDPSHIQHSSSSTPIESAEDDAAEPRSTPLLQALILGLFKLVGVGLVVYLTYFFTTMFAHRTPPPAPLSQEQIALAKKAEDLRAQGKKVLSSYGWVDPVTKSKLRIPIDRAMELYLAESNRPPAPPAAVPGPTATPAAPAAGPGTGATAVATTPAATTAPVATTAPAGMPPEQMYRLVCMACHDTDGKGKIVRLAMPSIPDLTDPKWQASRTDAELLHSILEGKESTVNGVRIPLMLPMKDKLALAHTEVKGMVAFMRAFKDGKQVVSATPGGMPAPGVPGPVAGGPTQGVPPTPAPPPSPPTNIGTERLAGSPPPQQPAPVSTPPIARAPAPVAALPSTAAGTGATLPPPLPSASTVDTAAQAEKIRAAGATFNTLCIACHGPDGRGTAVRAAMPLLPNFTSHDWHTTKSNSQLATSIMEGKGLMPPWNTQLTADRARDLALYVRSFGAPELMAEAPAASAPSTAEFDKEMQSLRQKFDDIEKQLQALATASPRP
ncbi:MAG: c-type cytochrome [Isosphaeraceae bacterium]